MSLVLDKIAGRSAAERGDDASPDRQRRRLRWAWCPGAAAVLVGTALLALSGSLYGRWIVDDAGITFDFARNIASGFGPVAQPGGPVVEGYSDPTWLALLIAGRKVGLFDHGYLFGIPDYVVYPKGLALLCCAGILVLVHRAARHAVRHAWLPTLLAGAVLAGTSSFVIWSFSGLENALYALLATGMAVLLLSATARGSLLRPRVAAAAGILAFLLALTRPDGLIYVAAYPLLAVVNLRRETLRHSAVAVAVGLAAFTVPYGGFLALRQAVFGRWLPLTAVAKNQSVPTLADLGKVGQLFSYAGWLLVAAAVVVTGVALASGPRARRLLAGPLVTLLLALAAFGILQPDWMPWYRFATPVWPLATLVLLVAVPHAAGLMSRRAGAVVAVLLAAGAVLSGAQQYATATSFRADPTVPLCAVVTDSGRAFDGLAEVIGQPDATVLTPDLGGSSLTSDLRLVDLAGLVDPTTASYWAAGDIAGLRDYVFTRLKPTFMKISSGWASGTGILADPRMRRDYTPLGDNGYGPGQFVRKSAVAAPGELAAARAYQRQAVLPARSHDLHAPLQSCGVLLPGQALPRNPGA
jgi:hypothetical protein